MNFSCSTDGDLWYYLCAWHFCRAGSQNPKTLGEHMPDQDPLEVYPVDSHDEQYDRLMWGCSDDDNHGEAVWDPGRQVWVMTGSIAIPGDGTYVSHNLDITTKNGDIYGYGTDVQRDSDARII
ncbi:hypothetical protein HZA87_03800, partial [Candidatus Uhrbacteria bacterium]|nr:hypothetical protein [Candidatus Uhrbacteria bacterium]